MDKKEIEGLIASMPLSDDEKADLMADLNGDKPPEAILDKIGKLLQVKEEALRKENPEAAAAYDEIDREYREEVQKAADEFNAKMKQLEQEADAVAKDVSRKLDAVRAEEIKASI